jgi:hypothetical protein
MPHLLWTDLAADSVLVLPYIAALVAKKKGKQLYYYVIESTRVDGRPGIVRQAYLGTADKVARLVKDWTALVSISATCRTSDCSGPLADRAAGGHFRLAGVAAAPARLVERKGAGGCCAMTLRISSTYPPDFRSRT